MYPEIEPYQHGMLEVGDGNHIYWETSGNPDGKPAVVCHGGPGSGSRPSTRQYFDPAAYRIVQFDQRGCGRSTPHAGDPATSLETNTTAHLVADIELLRSFLGIEKWLVMGGSWGSTLALVYAEQYPHRVSELVIPAVTTSRHSEHEWITRGLRIFFPDHFEAFQAGLPPEDRDGNIPAAYQRLLNSPEPDVRAKAAWDWCKWDLSTITGGENDFTGRFADPDVRYLFARLVTHYWGNEAFLEDGQVIRDLGKLAGIPGVLIHGRHDFGGPLTTAWDVAQGWPDAELVILNDAGHTADESSSMERAVLAALDRFRC